jgi:hypothetical protein
MKALLTSIFVWATLLAHPQAQSAHPDQEKGQLLDSIFPIDNIASVTVRNNSGAHILSTKEWAVLKAQLKQARYAGGLLLKPGYIVLQFALKDTTIAKAGFVYSSTGAIHVDGGTDKFQHRFSGTFKLPTQLNFDNYK